MGSYCTHVINARLCIVQYLVNVYGVLYTIQPLSGIYESLNIVQGLSGVYNDLY
jgi:hypothetical protein